MKTPFSQNTAVAFATAFLISGLMFLPLFGQPSTTLPTPSVTVSEPKGGSSLPSNTVRMLVWGIPQETCTAYGGKYDSKSGFSEWNTSLVLEAKSQSKIAGTLISGTRRLQFSSELDGKSALRSLLIKSGDMSFSVTVSPTSEKQVEIKIGKPSSETAYVYRYFGERVEVIKGTSESVSAVMDKWDAFLLLPLLSYKLGVEMRVPGNIYPAALPIHGVALSVAKKKDVQVYKMRDRDSDNPHDPVDGHGDTDGGTITPVGGSGRSDCAGHTVGTTAQECFGQCGPFWFGQGVCWEWVCGDCCCHVYCRDHDAACECGDLAACYIGAPVDLATFNIACAPCNNPGNLPCGDKNQSNGLPCNAGNSGGSSGGSACPSGQFYCIHSGSCQPNGSQCEPHCGPGTVYCVRLGRCVAKPQCDIHETCPSGYVRIFDKCYKREDTQ